MSDPHILGGKPVIKGTRISVAYVLRALASGMTVEELRRGLFPFPREAALAHAAELLG